MSEKYSCSVQLTYFSLFPFSFHGLKLYVFDNIYVIYRHPTMKRFYVVIFRKYPFLLIIVQQKLSDFLSLSILKFLNLF